jgi:hypothetical protein
MSYSAAEHLLSGPFGDPRGIAADMDTFTTGLQDLLRRHTGVSLPPVGEGADLVGDSITRATLVDALRRLVNHRDRDGAVEIMRRGAALLGTMPRRAQVDSTVLRYRLATDLSGFSAGRFVVEAIAGDLAPQTIQQVPATEAHAERIDAGVELLRRATGTLGTSTLGFVRGALLMDSSAVESAFIVPAPYVSVLNVSVLADPVATADALFHESCHQKFYDQFVCRRIVQETYDYMSGPKFDIPWTPVGGKRRQMDGLRVMSTLHVYSHLLELLLRVREHGLVPPEATADLDGKLIEYWHRGRFFDLLCDSAAVRESLGQDGPDLADWLGAAMDLHAAALAAAGFDTESPYTLDAREQIGRFEAAAVAPA